MSKNDLLRIEKTKDFINFVQSLGYSEAPKNGSSHRIFKCNGRPCLSIPNTRDIAPGTRRNLVKLVLGNGYYQ
jgi:predicted RNA binding protein YcfA (HicA-like mRNA interferase family)